ncbi:MAG: hypothetical protein H6Q75_854 [Firmicutes bacterium]|nr:hypothetical protein [Bacillota bacterium]
MKHWRIIAICICLVSILGIAHSAGFHYLSTEAVLIEGLQATGAIVEEQSLSAWCKLPDKQVNEESARAMIGEVAKGMGITPGEVTLKANPFRHTFVARSEIQDNTKHLVITLEDFEKVGHHEVYLTVNVEAKVKTDTNSLEVWEKRVRNGFAKVGKYPEISTCLVGWLNGKLEQDNWEKKLLCATKSMNAKDIQTVVQPEYISMSAYSPCIKERLRLGDKQVNVNVAIRYSSYDNRTYVIIGSPVIPGEY